MTSVRSGSHLNTADFQVECGHLERLAEWEPQQTLEELLQELQSAH